MNQKKEYISLERKPRLHGRAAERQRIDQPRLHGRAASEASDQPRTHGRAASEASDQPVLAQSVQAFFQTELFSRFVITVPAGDEELVRQLLAPFVNTSLISIIAGGATRQESVYNALKELEPMAPEVVLIHDGARPWITPELIRAVTLKTLESGSCIPVIDMIYALVEVNREGCIKRNLDRSKIKAVQTPQGFSFSRILKAHRHALKEGLSAFDDSALYRELYPEVFTIPGDVANKKITYKKDLS